MRVVVLVPSGGPPDPHRDRLWKFCRTWWLGQHPDWPIFEGRSPAGPFNRSAAVNDAARQAGTFDVAVIIDKDVIADPAAVRQAVDRALTSDRLIVSHRRRVMVGRQMTERILGGYRGNWHEAGEEVFTDSVSCCVAVSRRLWDLVDGFDERFVGWGYEDSAFEACAIEATGPIVVLDSELFHLWHSRPERVAGDRALIDANRALLAEIRQSVGAGGEPVAAGIPRILHRTVPASTSAEVEDWWERFGRLHPGWKLVTWRDPIDPARFPLTSRLWSKCQNGAQLAGLIRLEALVHHGGVYVDSDCEPYRSLEPLVGLPAFAAWEDETTVPDAVMAAHPRHPAFEEMLRLASKAVAAGRNAYESGPAISTRVLVGRSDVALLPPGSFYPYHYLAKNAASTTTAETAPWAFMAHHWHHSWGSAESKRSIAERQRA